MEYFELVLAKIILHIGAGERVSVDLSALNTDALSSGLAMSELCNAVVIPHKKRLRQCYTCEQKNAEWELFETNYHHVFDQVCVPYVEWEDIRLAISLTEIEDCRTDIFRDTCIQILQRVKACQIVEFRQSILLRIMSIIIRAILYGREPYDSILSECAAIVENDSSTFGKDTRFAFLE